MSESWKNPIWSIFLVCTFALFFSICNEAIDGSFGNQKSSNGIAYADFKPSDLSHIMVCGSSNPYPNNNSGAYYYTMCDASNNDSSIEATKTLKGESNRDETFNNVISLDALATNGWRFCKSNDNVSQVFCK
jgi:hypothetical protein